MFKRLLLVLSAFCLGFTVNSYAASTTQASHPSLVKGQYDVYVENNSAWSINLVLTTSYTKRYTLSPYGYAGDKGYLDLDGRSMGHLLAYTDDGYTIIDRDVAIGEKIIFDASASNASNAQSHPRVRVIKP